jgi:hypothetical protein
VPFAEDLRWLYASGRFALPLLPLTPLLLTSVSINPHKVTAIASLLNLPTELLIEIFRYLHVVVPSERVPFRRRTPPPESPSTSSSASVEDDPLGLSEYEMRLLQLALSTKPDIVRLLLEAPLEQRVILERQLVEGSSESWLGDELRIYWKMTNRKMRSRMMESQMMRSRKSSYQRRSYQKTSQQQKSDQRIICMGTRHRKR